MYVRERLTRAQIRVVERLIEESRQQHTLRPEVAAAIGRFGSKVPISRLLAANLLNQTSKKP